MGSLRGPESVSVRRDDTVDLQYIFSDKTVHWNGYPFKSTPVPFKFNRLTVERDKLIHFAWEIIHLLLSKPVPSEQLWEATRNLSERFRNWYHGLPPEFLVSKDMPSGLLELQYASGQGRNICFSCADFI